MEPALFLSPTGATRVASKLLEWVHVKSANIQREFKRGELLGYTIQVRTKCNQQYALTEDMLNDIGA